jgi:hypothetical protein
VLGASGVVLLLVAAGCGEYEKEYSISVEDRRGAGNMLEGVVIEGEGFSPNGTVLVTYVLSATGGNTQPYVEENVQADGNGEFRLEKQPVPCPQPADYRSGSFTLIVARDMTSGIAGSQTLEAGEQPDCTGSG